MVKFHKGCAEYVSGLSHIYVSQNLKRKPLLSLTEKSLCELYFSMLTPDHFCYLSVATSALEFWQV